MMGAIAIGRLCEAWQQRVRGPASSFVVAFQIFDLYLFFRYFPFI